MQREALYDERADLYDAIYHWKDYAAECERLREVLLAEGVADGARVLEAACGTGSHLEKLRQWYSLSGFDRSPEMLRVASTKLGPEGLFEADMAAFEAPEAPFDAVLCLFSSIGYLLDEQSLQAAARCFAAALRSGGTLVVEPWITPEDFNAGRGAMHTYDSEDLKLCRMALSAVEGEISFFDFHWLVSRPSKPVEHFVERHELRLFTRPQMIQAFEAAGFDVRFESDGLMAGRGLYVGRRR